MLDTKALPDPGIYLLADHLDAALAAGEDLIAETLSAGIDRELDDTPEVLPAYVARLAKLEAVIVARVLQARRRASELPRLDASTQTVIQLIIAQSTSLIALINQFGDQSEQRFMTGDDPLSFLRARGLVAEEAASLPRFDTLTVTDTYRIAGVIGLGPLLDMVAGALEALDIAYDLFTEDIDDEDVADDASRNGESSADVIVPAADAAAAGASAPGVDGATAPDETVAESVATEDETSRTASAFAQALQSMHRTGQP